MTQAIKIGRVTRALATREAVLRSLGLRAYDPDADADAPALFVGVYEGADLAAVARHRGPALVKFCGGDARDAAWSAGTLRELAAARPHLRLLAGTPLRADCERHRLPIHVWRNVYIGDAVIFAPSEPPGRRVYTYCPRARAEEYGIGTIRAVAAELPDVEFYVARLGWDDSNGVRWGDKDRSAELPFPNAVPLPAWLPQGQMPGILADCFCGIRTVPRDGFSVGATEVALMGRPVAHVTDMGVPWIEHAPTVEALIGFVRRAWAERGPEGEASRRERRAAARALAEDRSWLNLESSVGP